MKFSRNFPNFFLFFLANRRRRRTKEGKKKPHKKGPLFSTKTQQQHTSENKNVPTRSSSTVVDAIIGSTPREAFQQQTTTPASAGVDFDDAKKTPRRLGLVFGVGYYRSGERHGERFEIDRGAQFPPIIIFFVVLGRENYDSFSSFCFFRRSIERDARKTTFFFNSTKRPPHPPARALSSEGEKRGRRRRRRRKQRFGGGDSIRFESFFFLSTTTSLFQ